MQRTIAILIVLAAAAAHAQHEFAYITQWCAENGGEAEVTLPDGTRADCVTDTHAVEVERAANWKSGIGQALNYAFQTNKSAGIVLIMGDGDRRYWHMLHSVIEHYGLPISVWEVAR